MALLNLILGALFAALGLFDGQGTGGSGDGGGGSSGTGGSGSGSGGGSGSGSSSGSGSGDGGGGSSDTDDDDEDDDDEDDDPKAQAAKWKSLARKHERQAKSNAKAADRVRELEDRDKTDLQKAADRATTAERERDEARGDLLRLTVAIEKGLTPAQARRLQGSTKDELEADADELVEAFGGKNGERDKRDPLRRPSTKPKSGSVPDAEAEDNDPAKLAALVPRN